METETQNGEVTCLGSRVWDWNPGRPTPETWSSVATFLSPPQRRENYNNHHDLTKGDETSFQNSSKPTFCVSFSFTTRTEPPLCARHYARPQEISFHTKFMVYCWNQRIHKVLSLLSMEYTKGRMGVEERPKYVGSHFSCRWKRRENLKSGPSQRH